ncbi:MAG: ribonuclease Z [Syntrophorhabdus sp. PtaU1.Bin050]|nr:MAG: ribonuclease Z [Syntrophorhabdus sp. PtaU1.Bin050]
MKIEILGCYGNTVGQYRATSFLINDSVLLDGGTITEVLDDERLKLIRHIVISHTHIDHLKGLFPLIDQLVMMGEYSVELISTHRILDIITNDLFNDRIWPDFTAIPSKRSAMMRLREIEIEKPTSIEKLSLRAIPVSHTVACVGFVVREEGKGFMFTADTGPTQRFWEIAREERGIEFIIADVSFPNRLSDLARASGHMTLSILADHLERYGLIDIPIFITHMKPIFLSEILSELAVMGGLNIKPLAQGSLITL